MERAREKIQHADIILLVLDASRPLDHADYAVAGLLVRIKILSSSLTKPICLSAWAPDSCPRFLPADVIVAVSALHHTGISSSSKPLSHMVGKQHSISPSDILIANARHRVALEKTRTALGQARLGLAVQPCS